MRFWKVSKQLMSVRLIFVVLLGVTGANSQTASRADLQHEQTSNPVSDNPLIDSAQSSVYMEFKRVGKCPSSFRGDSIWLSLRNNTRWPILIRANGPADGCDSDASPFYSVEARESMVPEGGIPQGYWFDVASLVEIGPAEVLSFNVPKSHLDPGLSLRVDFEFSWEKNNRYTRHSSYFSYWDLPPTLRDKEKESKLKCIRGWCISAAKPPEMPEPPALIMPVAPSPVLAPIHIPLPNVQRK
jgi:hypothetical protein